MLAYRKPRIPNFKRLTDVAREHVGNILDQEVSKFADKSRVDFVNRIKRQDFKSFDATPLSPRYAAWKKKNKLDPRVMVATRHYINHIRVYRRHEPGTRKTVYRVGFHPRLQARDHKGRIVPVLMTTLARVREYGSVKMNVPARPHWGPQFKLMKKEAPKVRLQIRKRIMSLFRKKMRVSK